MKQLHIIEKDNVILNVGGFIGHGNLPKGTTLKDSTAIQLVEGKTLALGEKTIFNVGGLIGKMFGGELVSSGYDHNMVFTLSSDSGSNINIGGLVGFFTSTNSEEDSISKCYAGGQIIINTANTASEDQTGANIGGLIGFVEDNVNISDSNAFNDLYTYRGETSYSDYNSIGGIIGTMQIINVTGNNVQMERVYSISNVVANKSENPDSDIAGIIAKVISSDGFDVENVVNLNSVYYLAEFFIENNSIGQGLSVSEMLFNSETTFAEWDASIWYIENNIYPILKDTINKDNKGATRLNPEILSNLSDLYETNKASVILYNYGNVISQNTLTPEQFNNFKLNNIDIYFKSNGDRTLAGESTSVFNEVNRFSRIYNMSTNSVIIPLIYKNYGKVSGTIIGKLESQDNTLVGYIKENYGIDINPVIKKVADGSYVYGVNKGLVIYPKITASNNIIENGVDGQIKLGVFTLDNISESVFGGSQVIDSYIFDANEGNYIYYGHNPESTRIVLSEEQSKVFENYENTNGDFEFDLYNEWIMFPGADDEDRRYGRMFLRWELKETIGKTWYFEDIDLYSKTQTEYAQFVWWICISTAVSRES